METIKVKEITLENFNKYGKFANMIHPTACKIGEEPVEFYRDMLQLGFGQTNTGSFSICRVLKRPFIVDNIEFHTVAGEGVLPLDGDILLCVAPATAMGDVPVNRVEVFKVPKGTMVTIYPGVWHSAPFALLSDCVNVLIVLPERVYANDCSVVVLKEQERITIKN